METKGGGAMLNWLKRIIHLETSEELVNRTASPIIITIHGYGRRRKHEFDNLALWGKKDGFEIVQFDMYDLFNDEDYDWNKWVKRAKEVMNSYLDSHRDIYLVGFSMGGVIASYLASIYNVKKLILLAPAFSYVNMESITGAISKSASSFLLNDKKEEVQIPRAFYGGFTELVKQLKKYIMHVNCPVLFIHGDEDEVISVKSSLWAYGKLPHNKKKLIILHEGHHRLLMDKNVSWECYQTMKLFLDHAILHDQPIEMSQDIMGELIQKKRELQARILKESVTK